MKKEDLYLNIINNLHDGVYFVNAEREISFWNKAAENIVGYSAEEIVGKKCQETNLNHIDEDGRPLCVVGCPLFATIVDGKQRKERVFVRHKNGYRIPILVNIFPMEEDGKIIGAIEIFTQDSPTVYEDTLVEHLSGIAMHDDLTGLPNRRYLESFLNYKLDECKRFDKAVAVLFADIDDFSHFNDEYGHEAGDAVLKNIATSIDKSVRKDDLVGRWGGEEIVGVYSIGKSYEASILAERFRQLVEGTDVEFEGETLSVTTSVGVTLIQPGDTLDSVIERADKLMYQSKEAGKNCVNAD